MAGWAGSEPLALAGIEGTGSYGAGLACHIIAAGIRVVEQPARTGRTGAGRASPGPLDADWAARAAQSGRALREACTLASQLRSWVLPVPETVMADRLLSAGQGAALLVAGSVAGARVAQILTGVAMVPVPPVSGDGYGRA